MTLLQLLKLHGNEHLDVTDGYSEGYICKKLLAETEEYQEKPKRG
jgi:hypothetical protein